MEFQRGETVRHTRDSKLGTGVVVAKSRKVGPYSPWFYTVQFRPAGISLLRYAIAQSDLQPVAAPAVPVLTNGDTLPASGAVHDAVVHAIEERLAEERPRTFPGSNVIDLSARAKRRAEPCSP